MTIEFLEELTDDRQTTSHDTDMGLMEEPFQPKGALVFFCGMLVFYAVLWFSLYSDVLKRN